MIKYSTSKERLVSTRSICGHMAQWVVRQSPFHSARGVDRVNQVLLKASESWFSGCRWFGDYSEIETWLRDTLTGDPWLDRWNTSFSGAEGFAFSSRYDVPKPEHDFIDIDALLRNVAQSAWAEAAEYERDAA